MIKVKYFFPCGCGCGQMSDTLDKNYIKLRKSYKWYTKECAREKKLQIVTEFKNGVIVKQDDF